MPLNLFIDRVVLLKQSTVSFVYNNWKFNYITINSLIVYNNWNFYLVLLMKLIIYNKFIINHNLNHIICVYSVP